jgi:hypothetical protein
MVGMPEGEDDEVHVHLNVKKNLKGKTMAQTAAFMVELAGPFYTRNSDGERMPCLAVKVTEHDGATVVSLSGDKGMVMLRLKGLAFTVLGQEAAGEIEDAIEDFLGTDLTL